MKARMAVMHKNIYHVYKAIFCMFLAIIAANAFAADNDIIAAILKCAKSKDVSYANKDTINKIGQEVKITDESLEAQLAQIEADFNKHIDAQGLEANVDNLQAAMPTNAKSTKFKSDDLKILTDKNRAHKKIKIADNDELLLAAKTIDDKHVRAAEETVKNTKKPAAQKRVEDKILTCIEGADAMIKKCYKTRVVRAIQAPEFKFNVKASFAATSYNGHSTIIDLKTGTVSFGAGTSETSGSVENPINNMLKDGKIISIKSTSSANTGHTTDVDYEITQPSIANDFIYSCNIKQHSTGSDFKKSHRNNRNRNRGRAESWEVVVLPAPTLEESWNLGECARLEEFATKNYCEGPASVLHGVNQARTIPGYPDNVTRDYWQEELTYSCGGGSFTNECASLHSRGCTQIDSQCIKTKGPFCIEYLQTFNCGKREVKASVGISGTTIDIEAVSDQSTDGFDIEDFSQGLASLSMLDAMKSNIERNDQDQPLLFKGEHLSCDKEFGSDIKNCCNLKGIFKNIIGHQCSAQVREVLAPAVIKERRCHEVAGWYCVAKYPGTNKCRKWRKAFCCFQSDLARIFQQIAHHQLGISWGTPESPNCAPLDPQTFSRLNFDEPYAQKLLREIVDKVSLGANQMAQNANKNLGNVDIEHKVKALQERINQQYSNNGGAL